MRVQEPRNIRESRQTNHIAPRLRHRKLNELIIRNCQAAIGGHKYPVHENTHGNRHQCGGQKLNVFQTGDFIPRNQDDEGHNRHQNRPEVKVSKHVQAVFPQLQIAAERQRKLINDDNNADARQHTLNDGKRNIFGDTAHAQEAQGKLYSTRNEARAEEQLERAQAGNRLKNDRRQTRRRTGNTNVRGAQEPDDDTADNTRNNPRQRRCPRCQGNTQTQWQSHQENHQPRSEVGL